jgi:hypothetical protein
MVPVKGGDSVSWSVTVWLKTKKYVELNDLEYIIEKIPFIDEPKRITEFKDYQIVRGRELTFVSKSSSVAVSTNEIEYVKFDS